MATKYCLFFVLAIIVFTGCATTNRIPINHAGEDAGYVIISLGQVTETQYCAYELFFRTKDRSAENRVILINSNMFTRKKIVFKDSKSNGIVALLNMPAGEYEIFNFEVFENLGLIQTYYGAKNDFSIPFTVKPKTTTYVGEYLAVTTRKGLFGVSTGGAYFIVSDKSDRDLQLAHDNQPSISKEKFINAVPVPEKLGSPLLKSKPLI